MGKKHIHGGKEMHTRTPNTNEFINNNRIYSEKKAKIKNNY